MCSIEAATGESGPAPPFVVETATRIVFAAVLLMAAVGGCSSVPAAYHPRQPLDPASFSHDLFDQVLRSHIIDGRVGYPDPRRSGSHEPIVATDWTSNWITWHGHS
jgi:hypothetical protein